VTKLDKHRHDLAHWQADHGHPRLNR
jgi:hypothetical protein